jgi:hypothetical protein
MSRSAQWLRHLVQISTREQTTQTKICMIFLNHFNIEYGGSMFLRNTGKSTYKSARRYNPKDQIDMITAMITWNLTQKETLMMNGSKFVNNVKFYSARRREAPKCRPMSPPPLGWQRSYAGRRHKLGALITTDFIITVCLHAILGLVERLERLSAKGRNKSKLQSQQSSEQVEFGECLLPRSSEYFDLLSLI